MSFEIHQELISCAYSMGLDCGSGEEWQIFFKVATGKNLGVGLSVLHVTGGGTQNTKLVTNFVIKFFLKHQNRKMSVLLFHV